MGIKTTGIDRFGRPGDNYLMINCMYTLREKGLAIQLSVARFFLVQNTKTGKHIPNFHEQYQMSIKYNKTVALLGGLFAYQKYQFWYI
jgi:hypothetical protein